MIPVGSSVTKTIRKEAFMIDIILNYNKTALNPTSNPQSTDFNKMITSVE